MCNINAYSEAKKDFAKKDPEVMANNSGGKWVKEDNKLLLKYLNHDIEVSFPSGEILSSDNFSLVKNDKVLILQYLSFASGAAPRNNWISFLQLPGGPHHHIPFVQEAIEPLANEFGEDLGSFEERAKSFGGQEIKMGDLGFSIPVFPKIPMAICIRRGDDEFPASANILFDAAASLHLTTAALWVLGVELSRRFRQIQGQQYS